MSRRKQSCPQRKLLNDVAAPADGTHQSSRANGFQRAQVTKRQLSSLQERFNLQTASINDLCAFSQFVLATKRAPQQHSGIVKQATVEVVFESIVAIYWQLEGLPQLKHEAWFQAPNAAAASALLRMLRNGHLAIACQQAVLQHNSGRADSATVQEQQGAEAVQGSLSDSSFGCCCAILQDSIVQFKTLEVPSTCLQVGECDIITAPHPAAVQLALQHAGAAAGAALLPTQHISLMATAAGAPERSYHHHNHHQQQQHSVPDNATTHITRNQAGSGGCVNGAGGDTAGAGDAAADLTLWRFSVGLTEQGMRDRAATSPDQQVQINWHQNDLLLVWSWLVPHWVPNLYHRKQSRTPWPVGCSKDSNDSSTGFDAAELYSAVKPRGNEVAVQMQPPELLPELRPYQRRAVAWMLGREGMQEGPYGHLQPLQLPQQQLGFARLQQQRQLQQLHPLWRCGLLMSMLCAPTASNNNFAHVPTSSSCSAATYTASLTNGGWYSTSRPKSMTSEDSSPAADGEGQWNSTVAAKASTRFQCKGPDSSAGRQQHALYFSPYSGLVSTVPMSAPQATGGILADEMGLGKTVELLALIMTHRFQCIKQEPAGQSAHGSTLAINAVASKSMSRQSTSSNGYCASCGEVLEGAYYTKDGWKPQRQQQQRSKRIRTANTANQVWGSKSDSDIELIVQSEQTDSDQDFTPCGSRAKQAAQGKRRRQQQHRATAGVDYQPAKRQRRSSNGKQQQYREDSGNSDEETGFATRTGSRQGSSAGRRSSRGRAIKANTRFGGQPDSISGQSARIQQQLDEQLENSRQQRSGILRNSSSRGGEDSPATASAAAAAAGAVGMMCNVCLRKLALQEVDEDCPTTLIVVPSNILVQWVDELLKHIRPGTLSLKVYAGQYQPTSGAAASTAVATAAQHGVRESAAAAAATAAAAAATAAGRVVTAAELASADVVVTTYEVLRRELALQPGNDVQERSLRQRKRYAVVPTPLSRLRFWRLVVDEAQQVAGSTAKAAEMAQHVKAKYRWAVTGTPISRGLEDVAGLLSYLQVYPWTNKWWWNKVIAQPLAAGCQDARTQLLQLLSPATGGLLWRSAKADVLHEMGLPPQHHHTTVLRLSAIERHWYNRAHQDCAAKARKVLQDAIVATIIGSSRSSAATTAAKASAAAAASAAIAAGGDGRELTGPNPAMIGPLLDHVLAPTEQKRLLLPLLRLRQACCHPQVGAAGLRAALLGGSSSTTTPLTMDQILGVLTTRAKTEAEEAQRQLLGALNGLAALMRLASDGPGAVRTYRESLATSEANKQEVRTDPLQLYHVLSNLHDLLMELKQKQANGSQQAQQQLRQQQQQPYGPNVPYTLRDESLASEAATIQKGYLAQREAELAVAHAAYMKAMKDAQLVVRSKQQPQRGLAQAAAAAAAAQWGAAGSSNSSWQQALAIPVTNAVAGEDSDEDAERKVESSDAVAGPAAAGWYVSVIDALHNLGRDKEVADLIRERLQEGDLYRQKVAQNASSLANRFDTLHGLKLLISRELSAMSSQQTAAVTSLEVLQTACSDANGPDKALVAQAGQCGRCRSDVGVAGVLCRHCKLDEVMRRWEVRLFSLHTRALVAGTQVDADMAARQAQIAALRRVGRGGLNEAAADETWEGDDISTAETGATGTETDGPAAAGGISRRQQGSAVSETQVVRHPSEVERVLRLLQQQLSRHGLARQLDGVSEAASHHLDMLEGCRRLFTAASQLALAQRQMLYAHDEVAMARLSITTRLEGEQVSAHEAFFKLTAAEQVIKNSELSVEKALAAGELSRALGTLRYLKTIAAARQRAVAVAAAKGGPGALTVTATAAAIATSSAASAAAAPVSGSAADFSNTKCSKIAVHEQHGPEPDRESGASSWSPRQAAAAAALRRAAGSGQGQPAQQHGNGTAGASQPCSILQLAAAPLQQPLGAAIHGEQAGSAYSTAAAADATPAPTSHSSVLATDTEEHCPICHDEVESATAVLPCGHMLCCSCADTLASRIPVSLSGPARRISCPSCRAEVHVSDVAYVDSGHSSSYTYVRTESMLQGLPAAAAAAKAVQSHTGRPFAVPNPGSSQFPAAASANQQHHSKVASSGGEDSSNNSCPWAGEQQLVLSGSYGTKVEAVVKRLLFIMQQDFSCKAIVFSTWLDVLEIVSHALVANGVAHAFGKGRKGLLRALEKFKGSQVTEEDLGGSGMGKEDNDSKATKQKEHLQQARQQPPGLQDEQQQKAQQQRQQEQVKHEEPTRGSADGSEVGADDGVPSGNKMRHVRFNVADGRPGSSAAAAAANGPRVLLMLISQGSAGLNLTEAQHVIMLEPLLDPAQDVQSIGRISRFGQTKKTHVHRFIIEHTVEENVARLSRQRAAAMDMSAAVPIRRRSAASSGGPGTGAGGDAAQLTVREVAALLSTKWRDAGVDAGAEGSLVAVQVAD